MIQRTIHTFYEPIEERCAQDAEHIRECQLVLGMWRDSWRAHGWEPVVIDSSTARQHPLYDAVMHKANSMPLAHEQQYNDRCYQRWLAAAVCGGWYSDPDMINYSVPPPDIPDDSVVSFCPGNVCPNVIYMTKEKYESVILRAILDYHYEEGHQYVLKDASGRAAVNDMQLLSNSKCQQHVNFSLHIMGEYGRRSFHGVDDYDQNHAPIVHYHGPYLNTYNLKTTKSKLIMSANRRWPRRWVD